MGPAENWHSGLQSSAASGIEAYAVEVEVNCSQDQQNFEQGAKAKIFPESPVKPGCRS
jgi:hypothetical protein